MATYASVHELLAAWPKVHTSALSHDEMRTLLERASNLIDSKIARRYDVPFTLPAPPRIRDLTVDLAMTDILYRSAEPSPIVLQRINWALESLKDIAEGNDSLVGTDGTVIDELAGVDVLASNTSDYAPVFGAVPSLHERDDPSRAADENAARGLQFTPDSPAAQVWFYEYVQSDGKKARFKMLLVFVHEDRYMGHMWFSAAHLVEVTQ